MPVGRRVRIRVRRMENRVERSADPAPVQHAAATVGAVITLIGLLGFLPGITIHFGAMEFAGSQSQAMLVGTFSVSVLHNVIHLLLGITGIALARGPALARGFLLGGGVFSVLLALVCWGVAAEALPANTADNWLHLGLGAGMLALAALPTSAAGGRPTGAA